MATAQHSLLFTATQWTRDDKPKKPVRLTIRERFEAFDKANPFIYRHLVREALNLKHNGFHSYSMKTLFEVLRWERDRNRANNPAWEKFELNNDFTAHYARLLMANHEELKGFFEIRETK
jgi:hypothetical protein